MGLYTPTILGGNFHLSWFYDRGAIKDPAHTGTSKRVSQAINRGPIRKFLPKYANVYVTIQSHALSAGVRTYYVTANEVRNGLGGSLQASAGQQYKAVLYTEPDSQHDGHNWPSTKPDLTQLRT